MLENDLELKLLRGSPIEVKDVGMLYPLILDEIKDIGENQYNRYIFAATFKQDDLEIEGRKLTPFESVLVYCVHDETFRALYLDSLKKFFREDVHFHQSGFFYLGNIEDQRFIGQDKFSEIVEIIKKQNFIKNQEEEKDEFNPHDDKARELIEKLKSFRQKVKEQNQNSGLNLSDVISIIAAHSSNINIFNVWEMTVYQLYTMYIRLMMKENYDSQYYLLPHVSDQKSLDLKHWATKIDK